MKHKLLLLLACLLATATASAYTFEVDEIYYNITSDNTVEVTYSLSNYPYNNADTHQGAVTIPSSVTYGGITYSVTTIGKDAFYNCTSLTSVTIPNSVTTIGDYAFYECSSLTSVEIPNSVTTIGGSAFGRCSSMTSVTISNSVTTIEGYAFYSCSSLTSVEIPNSVTEIGNSAFGACTSLTSVEIPNSVTTIGESAFYWCAKLTTIEIPGSVTTIGGTAFCGCKSLTSVAFPNSVTTVGYAAFAECSNLEAFYGKFASNDHRCIIVNDTLIGFAPVGLTTYTIPSSITTIGSLVFNGCTELTSVTIPNSVTTIGNNAFKDCISLPVIDNIRYADTYLVEATDKSLNSYNIKEGTRFIGSYAFQRCSNLTAVEIPRSVTTIGSGAFQRCSSLTSVEIPNSVTTIGNNAFEGCSSLTAMEIPNSITTIKDWAFNGCSCLTSVEIPNSVTTIGEFAFQRCSNLTSVTIPNSVTTIGIQAFYGCSQLAEITSLNTTPPALKSSVFYDVPKSTCVLKVPAESVDLYKTAYGWKDFFNIVGIEEEEDVDEFEVAGIYYKVLSKQDLTVEVAQKDANMEPYTGDIVIPATVTYKSKSYSVTTIRARAFYGCTGLTSVTLPNSITTVGYAAFAECHNLEAFYGKFASEDHRSIIVNGTLIAFAPAGLTTYTIPANVTAIGEYVFMNYTQLTSIIISVSVTNIMQYAFYGCAGLTSVEIPAAVTTIGQSAFHGCTALTSLTIPAAVVNIGQNAFHSCPVTHYHCDSEQHLALFNSTVEHLTIGNNVTTIRTGLFQGCTNLRSVTIGNAVTTIGYKAFAECHNLEAFYGKFASEDHRSIIVNGTLIAFAPAGLTTYTIPANVTAIGEYVFMNYTQLTSIIISVSVTNIMQYAFYGCAGLTSMEIPAAVTTIGQSAFHGCTALTSLTIPASVVNIGQNAFHSCPVTHYHCDSEQHLALFNSTVEHLTIGNNVTTIRTGLFQGCNNLRSVTIGNAVTTIGYKAFAECHNLEAFYGKFASEDHRSIIVNGTLIAFAPAGLTTYTIPANVTAIGEYVFMNYTQLTSIIISVSVTNIMQYAFYGCVGLTSMEIPAAVTTIGQSAFHGCTALTSLTIPASVVNIGQNAFHSCPVTHYHCDSEQHLALFNSTVEHLTIGNTVTTIRTGLFQGCNNLRSVTIGNAVTTIGYKAFAECHNLEAFYGKFASEDHRSIIVNGTLIAFAPAGLTTYTIPANVTAIGEYVFMNYTQLTSIIISVSVTNIMQYAFYGCAGLTSVEIPALVTTIRTGTFQGCISLRSVVLGRAVSVIEGSAFNGCTNLADLTSLNTTPPVIGSSFSSVPYSTCVLNVPAESMEAYKATEGWREFENIVGIEPDPIELSIPFTVSKAEYATLILPFDAEVPEGLQAYTCSEIRGGALVLRKANRLEACTPYIIYGYNIAEADDNEEVLIREERRNAPALSLVTKTYTFTGYTTTTTGQYAEGELVGTLEDIYAPEGSYVLQQQGGVVGFYRVAAENHIPVKANRCYLREQSSLMAHAFTFIFEDDDDEETGIAGLTAGSSETTPAYTLGGQRAGKGYRGIVIRNGRKVLRK